MHGKSPESARAPEFAVTLLSLPSNPLSDSFFFICQPYSGVYGSLFLSRRKAFSFDFDRAKQFTNLRRVSGTPVSLRDTAMAASHAAGALFLNIVLTSQRALRTRGEGVRELAALLFVHLPQGHEEDRRGGPQGCRAASAHANFPGARRA